MAYKRFKDPFTVYGSGLYAPQKTILPEDLEDVVTNFNKSKGTYAEFSRKHFGTEYLHEADPNEYTSDILVKAAERAIQDSGVLKKDIAAIVIPTITPDDRISGSRSFVLEKLGLFDREAYEPIAACGGLLASLTTAYAVVSMTGKYVAIIGGDITRNSRGKRQAIINKEDLFYSGLVDDGAAAIIVGPGEENHGFIDHFFSTNSSWNNDAKEGPDGFFRMDGGSLKIRVGPLFYDYIKESVQKNNLDTNNLVVAVHQVNGRLLESLATQLNEDPDLRIDKSRVINVFNKYGNIVSGSMLLALHSALQSGLVKKGTAIVGAGVGAGFDHGYYTFISDRTYGKKNLRLLIVDDESKEADVLKNTLERCIQRDMDINESYNVSVDVAYGANSAISKAGQLKYDFFIVDQRMPSETGGKGTDLVEKLRQFQDTKAIIHSGASEDDDKKIMVSNPSILEYIPKPFLQAGYTTELQPNWIILKKHLKEL